jgi:CrcB protein
MARFFWVCFAGALGTGARYLIGLGTLKALGAAFPWGTLLVNVIGCFLIAGVMRAASVQPWISPDLRFALTTGFLGGLTTYSSFNYETTRFFEERAWLAGAANLGVTVLLCFGAGLLGALAARRLFG